MFIASPRAPLLGRPAAARLAAVPRHSAPRYLRPPAPEKAFGKGRSWLLRAENGESSSGGASDDIGDEEENEKPDDGNSTPTPPQPPPPTPHPRRNRPSSRDTARALEALAGPAHQKIGAEYGEGFVQFRPGGGQPLSLDVDALNERLSPSGAVRLRRSLVAPDEAHGVSFFVLFFVFFFFSFPRRKKKRRKKTLFLSL